MALNKVHLPKTKRSKNVDKYGAYHPPTYYKGKPLSKPSVRPPARGRVIDLTDEFRKSTILSIPRDALPEYLDELIKQYGRPAVYSAVLQQYDIYKLSPSPVRDWLKAALEYLKAKT